MTIKKLLEKLKKRRDEMTRIIDLIQEAASIDTVTTITSNYVAKEHSKKKPFVMTPARIKHMARMRKAKAAKRKANNSKEALKSLENKLA